ncbi:unnamed protein product, partial [marine sediment metagenome]
VKKAVKKTAGKSANADIKKSVKKVHTARQTKPKSPLTPSELRSFRKILLEKRHELIGDLNGIETEALRRGHQNVSGDLSTLPTHPADVGTDNYEQEFSLGLLESERELLAKIDAALGRIEDKTYGICMGTGKAIAKARLGARPWTRYCIEYAEMLEKGTVRPQIGGDSYGLSDEGEDYEDQN